MDDQRGIIRRVVLALGLLALGCITDAAWASRIKDLCEIQGARGNTLKGIGLVVGLAGTGDQAAAAIRAQERMLRRLSGDPAPAIAGAQARLLRRLGIEFEREPELKSDNVAVVVVTGVIPSFAKEGTRIDVHVSSVYDCKSLEGGVLMETLLKGVNDEVYAVAQGPISVGGFNTDAGGGTSVRNNHTTGGRIPMGGYVEREIPSTITDGERIMLLLKRPDFGTANNVQKAINERFEPGTASALGAGTVSVMIPEEERRELVRFIARVQDIDVESDVPSRVVINERTGTIVIGGDVRIRPCQVAHGGLTITIATTPQISQPLPFSAGATVETATSVLSVEEQDAALMPLEGASAADVAEGLNRLHVTPRDIISIFQALRRAGVMDADLEIM